MLPVEQFKMLLDHAPLFAIDLVVVNSEQQLLVGLRKNAPAQNYWFVPGGRVFKGETQREAFGRISAQEIGKSVDIENAVLLGIYDHLYDDSVFGDHLSTHYINATYLIKLDYQQLNLPIEQHAYYRWVDLDSVEIDQTIHFYSKVFLKALSKKLMSSPGDSCVK